MIYVLIAMSVFIADIWVKKIIETKLPAGTIRSFLGGRIKIQKIHNRGMAFNSMDKWPKFVRKSSGVLLIVWLLGFIRSLTKKGHAAEKTGRALVLGGGFSNWFDRFHQGYVTDYIHFRLPFRKIREYYCNLSDFCIGIGMVLTLLFRKRKKS